MTGPVAGNPTAETAAQVTLRIHPEPSPEERVAITAAITAALDASLMDEETVPTSNAWGRAGRLEALRSPLRE